MQHDVNNNENITAHRVWDRTTRWFHWINLACILVLASLGLFILYDDEFGFSQDGKVLLKTLHVYAGYVFTLNLLWRLVWAFIGNRHARWRAFLPFRKGYLAELRTAVREFSDSHARRHLGHDPLARLMITLLLVLMITQACTGLVLAGTDLYMLPFGGWIAEWVTRGDPGMLANLKPGYKEYVDLAAYDEMRAWRSLYKEIHEYGFYVLASAIVLHIAGVIVAEVRQKQGLVSGMFSGQKLVKGEPLDKHDD